MSISQHHNSFTHRILSLLFSLSFLMVIFSCNSDNDTDKNTTCNNNADCRSLTIDDDSRLYITHIPSSYNADDATPLVINFHGFGGTAENFSNDIGAGNSNLNAVANANNFIVVYPQGIERTKGDTEWDPGDNGISSILENDVFFVEKLIEDISNQWNIDPLRIYATGYSNGGMMAYGLACNRSDIFAAVGIMSGIMLVDNCDQTQQTSIIHFHGIDDEVLPYNGNQDYQAISTVVDFWVNHNQIPSSSLQSTTLNDGDVISDIYSDSGTNLSFALYTINNELNKPGGHVWFTGSIDGKQPNDILWEFLSSHRLDD